MAGAIQSLHPTATANEEPMNIETVTIPSPAKVAARRQGNSIEYAPAATEKELAQYRLELELDRQARNRGVCPKPMRAPAGA